MALSVWMLVLTPFGFTQGRSLDFRNSPCGDWIPYHNEQCIKMVERSGLQTKMDAEIICQSYADGSDREIPTLITLKTKEKQEFLEKYLFEDKAIVDNVWLGLDLGEDGVFRWHDGSELHFTNWMQHFLPQSDKQCTLAYGQQNEEGNEEQSLISDQQRVPPTKEHNCVQMESGDGVNARGLWTRANCKASLRIVCEKNQIWSLTTVQNALLNFKLEFEDYKKEAEESISKLKHESEKNNLIANQKLDAVKQETEKSIAAVRQEAEMKLNTAIQASEAKMAATNQELNTLKQNAVPLNFLYTQLPGQKEPSTLWPQFGWSDVSSSYSGLFFRVAGGSAAPFGQVQESSAPRLEEVQQLWQADKGYDAKVSVPSDGSWSRAVNSGKDAGGKYFWSLMFRVANHENRPRNQAIKVWQRIK